MAVFFYTKPLFVYILIVFTFTDNLGQFKTVSAMIMLMEQKHFIKVLLPVKTNDYCV